MKPHIWTSYEVTWTPEPNDFLGLTGDFWLIQHIERWLIDLAYLNTDDDVSHLDKEWWIFHVTPGHAFIFLHLTAADLKSRIQSPLKRPVCGWTDGPIPSSLCTESFYETYWDFHVKLQEMRLQPVISESHQCIAHRVKKNKKNTSNTKN